MFIKRYHLYERETGKAHDIDIHFNYCEAKQFEVTLDNKPEGSFPNMVQATDKAVDIVIENDLTNIRPF